jgi:hypothetical protein
MFRTVQCIVPLCRIEKPLKNPVYFVHKGILYRGTIFMKSRRSPPARIAAGDRLRGGNKKRGGPWRTAPSHCRTPQRP